ncbi:UNVERIFIED_CONTAM: hypothetical protein FKN15_030860 [Acipenser sinensis]
MSGPLTTPLGSAEPSGIQLQSRQFHLSVLLFSRRSVPRLALRTRPQHPLAGLRGGGGGFEPGSPVPLHELPLLVAQVPGWGAGARVLLHLSLPLQVGERGLHLLCGPEPQVFGDDQRRGHAGLVQILADPLPSFSHVEVLLLLVVFVFG